MAVRGGLPTDVDCWCVVVERVTVGCGYGRGLRAWFSLGQWGIFFNIFGASYLQKTFGRLPLQSLQGKALVEQCNSLVKGLLAQLVQSTCLTSRGSLVRIQ